MKKWIIVLMAVMVVFVITFAKNNSEEKIITPVNVSINLFDNNVVVLQWDAVDNADLYYIYGSSNPFDSYSLIDSTNTNLWAGVISDTIYFLK